MGNIRRKLKSCDIVLGQPNREEALIALLHKKFGPSGNGPKEGLGLVCRCKGNNHFIDMLSSF